MVVFVFLPRDAMLC